MSEFNNISSYQKVQCLWDRVKAHQEVLSKENAKHKTFQLEELGNHPHDKIR